MSRLDREDKIRQITPNSALGGACRKSGVVFNIIIIIIMTVLIVILAFVLVILLVLLVLLYYYVDN